MPWSGRWDSGPHGRSLRVALCPPRGLALLRAAVRCSRGPHARSLRVAPCPPRGLALLRAAVRCSRGPHARSLRVAPCPPRGRCACDLAKPVPRLLLERGPTQSFTRAATQPSLVRINACVKPPRSPAAPLSCAPGALRRFLRLAPKRPPLKADRPGSSRPAGPMRRVKKLFAFFEGQS
jgi:hypothetical protein